MSSLNLNEEQEKAATCPLGYNLIIASAGTGKTSTIVARIAHLLKQSIDPKEILLLTFTNKAASEMLNRIASIFDDNIAKNIQAGTFHSISYKLLKSLDKKIMLKQPSELKTLFKSIYEKRVFLNRDEKSKPYDGSYLYDSYSLYLNTKQDESFTTWLCEKNESQEFYCEIYEDVFEEFNELKKHYGYVNFDDLLVLMLENLKTNHFDFKEILVDEYQDTNPLQGKLLDAFLPKSLFCVGDYDQSIYAFNGSDISIISTFSKRYPSAKVFTLRKNYRSLSPILDLASKVIENNERIYEKNLEVMREEKGMPPKLLVFDELFAQYQYLSEQIANSKNEHEQIAVIYRNNASADGIEANLREYDIPSNRKGGMSFFDSLEVKFFLNTLTLILNHNDMMAFISIIEYGNGIGKASAKDIFDALIKLGNGDLLQGLLNPNKDIKNPYEKTRQRNIQLGLFDDFLELGSVSKFKGLKFEEKFLANPVIKHPKLNPKGAKYFYDFYLLFQDLKKLKNPSSIIKHISTSDIFKDISKQLCTKRATQKDGSVNPNAYELAINKISTKIVLLQNLAKHYSNLNKFLNSMVLGGSELSGTKGVNLLSIHASKGLEFKEVYIIDIMEGRFPNLKLISKGGSLEEERRLFYVGVTRAKDELYLSYAKYDKIKKQDFVPSIFLKEAGLIANK